MKTKALATCILLVLIVASVGSVASVQGEPGEGDWFTRYRVEDLRTGQLMVEMDFATGENRSMTSIFAGSEVAVTFTIDVPVTLTSTILKMSTALINATQENMHWVLVSEDYKLRNFNPNSTEITFQQVKGELTMKLYGKIPLWVLQDTPVQYILISLYNPDEEVLDEITVTVIPAQMDTYQSLLVQKEDELQALKDGEVDPGYIELYENVLNESKVQASLGYVDNAISMLKALEVKDKPAFSTENSLFLPVVSVLTAVAAVLGILFVRERIRKNNLLKHGNNPAEQPHN